LDCGCDFSRDVEDIGFVSLFYSLFWGGAIVSAFAFATF